MATIMVANTNNEVKEAIQKGCRFKIAPSVTQVLVEGTKINYEYVAEALQNSSSVKQLSVDQLSTPDSKLELLLEAVSFSRALQSLIVRTESESTIEAIGHLLQLSSSITGLAVSSDREIRSEEFFSGLEFSRSLREVQLRNNNWSETSIEAVQDMYKNLRCSLCTNQSVEKFTIKTGIISDDYKITGLQDLAPDGITSIDQAQYIEILIEQAPSPKQMIESGNWDRLHNYMQDNYYRVDRDIDLSEFNLITKTAVAKFIVQSLPPLVEEKIRQKKIQLHKIEETTVKIEELENELAKLKARLTNQNHVMDRIISREELLHFHLNTYQLQVKKSELAMKKWQSLIQIDLQEWNCEDVSMFLSVAGLSMYSEIFRENKIDGAVLTTLDTNDMMSALNLSFKEAKALRMYIYLIQTHHDIYTIPAGVLQWNNDTVCTWIEANKFGHLVDVFKQNEITGPELVFLEKIDITHHLQINALGDIVNLQKAISILKESLQSRPNKNNKDSEANNDTLLEHQRQLEEMKLTNEKLTKTLKERETKIPDAFICPITHDIMSDPVVASDGHTYERTAIELWLKTKNTSPITGLKLAKKRLTPSHTLKSFISEFVENKFVDVSK